ncbi:serine/threonine-protein kinase [Actinoplanes sp. NPDC049548]|uniref:serine/threonine-protein kinase n=1 Tax=Actinoplanes sp. NPDC049548 TaxID=3155152 RepID=UPI00341C0C61
MLEPALRPGDPRSLGGYSLVERLGEGGMGTVFLGLDRDGREVAVKVVRREFLADEEVRNRFRSEVSRARQVPSFSTAEVLDADPDHDPPYLVVEFVDGPSLAYVLRREGPLPPAALHSVAVGIATALTAIHSAGVVHRDLKPENVLLARGGPKVIDFGIARPFEMTSRHTRTNHMVGTVAYMAPERFEDDASHQVTPAMDIFAWGALVTYAGTGRTPFAADSAPATAARILTQPPQLGSLAEPLRSIVALTLAKDPAARPDAHELLSMLLSGRMPPSRQTAEEAPWRESGDVPWQGQSTDAPKGRRPAGRTRMALVSATVVAVAVAAGLTVQQNFRGRTDSPRPTSLTESPVAPKKPGLATGIFSGERRTVVHLVEVDRELTAGSGAPRAAAPAGKEGLEITGTPEEMFALVPYGNDHLVRAVGPAAAPGRECLHVEEPVLGTSAVSVKDCTPGPATLFTLVPTGHSDGGPTFLISSQGRGELQWSTVRKELYVQPVGSGPITTTFRFVDQGPLR